MSVFAMSDKEQVKDQFKCLALLLKHVV